MSAIAYAPTPTTDRSRTQRPRTGTRGAPTKQSIRALQQQIDKELSKVRRQEARLAAMILIAYRERIGDRPIGEYLMNIQAIERDTVAGWLRNAKVNPWRRGDHLSSEQVEAIARELIAFWKDGPDL